MSNGNASSIYKQSAANANQNENNAQGSYGTASGLYGDEALNPGYSNADKTAITQATVGGLAGAANSAITSLRNRAAATGNGAGANDTAKTISRTEGQDESQALGGLQEAFANKAIAGRQNAAAGEAGLYGEGNNAANAENATAGQISTQPTFWQKLALVGAQAAGNYLSNKGKSGQSGAGG
jgi:hypothetical protein